jgi:hypothetical protein
MCLEDLFFKNKWVKMLTRDLLLLTIRKHVFSLMMKEEVKWLW